MMVLLTRGTDSFAQLAAALAVFVLVLGITAVVTRWIANYQKQQNASLNVEVIETTRIAANKYIQIVRLGQSYVAIAVCKDSVARLCEIPEDQIKRDRLRQGGVMRRAGFRELFEKAVKGSAAGSVEAGDDRSDDENKTGI